MSDQPLTRHSLQELLGNPPPIEARPTIITSKPIAESISRIILDAYEKAHREEFIRWAKYGERPE